MAIAHAGRILEVDAARFPRSAGGRNAAIGLGITSAWMPVAYFAAKA
jgi:hypothetical protein